MITFNEFKQTELKVATILEVKEHPNADRLWVLKVDLGNDVTKEIVAGIRLFYSPEDLVGKQVIIVDNLEPTTIRGVTSNGMLQEAGAIVASTAF